MIKNVHGNTVDFLGEAIVSGKYPVGGSLPPEPVLCEQLGVSRTVIRESVKSLVAKGLIVTGPKVGTRVLSEEQWNWFDPDVIAWQAKAGLTAEFLRDLQELRKVVEPAAVRLAAERATATDIQDVSAAYAGMKKAIEEGGDYVTHDMHFHTAVLDAVIAKNPDKAEKAIRVLIEGAHQDMEHVLTSRRKLPTLSGPAKLIKAQ
jgi:DNA-binding FadR family transcriptional regulator